MLSSRFILTMTYRDSRIIANVDDTQGYKIYNFFIGLLRRIENKY